MKNNENNNNIIIFFKIIKPNLSVKYDLCLQIFIPTFCFLRVREREILNINNHK